MFSMAKKAGVNGYPDLPVEPFSNKLLKSVLDTVLGELACNDVFRNISGL